MVLAHRESEPHYRDTPAHQREFFESEPYFAVPWKALNQDIDYMFRRYGRGSWDPRWRSLVDDMPNMSNFDPISIEDGCRACGRKLECAVFYGSITISGPGYDKFTLVRSTFTRAAWTAYTLRQMPINADTGIKTWTITMGVSTIGHSVLC